MSRSIPSCSGVSLHVQEYPSCQGVYLLVQEYPSMSRSISSSPGVSLHVQEYPSLTGACLHVRTDVHRPYYFLVLFPKADTQVNDLCRYILCSQRKTTGKSTQSSQFPRSEDSRFVPAVRRHVVAHTAGTAALALTIANVRSTFRAIRSRASPKVEIGANLIAVQHCFDNADDLGGWPLLPPSLAAFRGGTYGWMRNVGRRA